MDPGGGAPQSQAPFCLGLAKHCVCFVAINPSKKGWTSDSFTILGGSFWLFRNGCSIYFSIYFTILHLTTPWFWIQRVKGSPVGLVSKQDQGTVFGLWMILFDWDICCLSMISQWFGLSHLCSSTFAALICNHFMDPILAFKIGSMWTVSEVSPPLWVR